MEGRALIEKSVFPKEEVLKEVLKDSYRYYVSLTKYIGKYENKWMFYKGWSQKFFDKKKALFYLAPYFNYFVVSMAIRENEKEELLKDMKLAFAHEKLKESQKYIEGYSVKFIINDDKSYQEYEKFLGAILLLR